MTISVGYDTKKLTLYPHATPSAEPENSLWMNTEDESALPLLTIGKAMSFKDEIEDDLINYFICDPSAVTQHMHYQLVKVFDLMAQEELNLEIFSETADNQSDSAVTTIVVTTDVVTIDDETSLAELFPKISSKSVTIEIEPGKTLNINPDLSNVETPRLMNLLIVNKEAFAWDYMDMKEIPSELCTHHIYIK
jgi:hypothetical protein